MQADNFCRKHRATLMSSEVLLLIGYFFLNKKTPSCHDRSTHRRGTDRGISFSKPPVLPFQIAFPGFGIGCLTNSFS